MRDGCLDLVEGGQVRAQDGAAAAEQQDLVLDGLEGDDRCVFEGGAGIDYL